jgi:hypothetical protein
MGLTFAEQPLLLDWKDQIRDYLDRYVPQAFHTLFCPTPPAFTNGEWVPKHHIRAHVGIPYANWTPPTDLRLNTLYWPSGASRWGYGLFLADSARMDKIKAKLLADGQDQMLRFTTDHWPKWETALDVKMRMLAPIQLPTGPGHGDQLYLVPLVDQRWFWQWRDAGSLEIEEDDTWLQLFAQLEHQLDATMITDWPDGQFYQPNITEFCRSYHNAAMLLDAAAWSTGMRVSVGFDGTVHVKDPTLDSFRLGKNQETVDFVAGGKTTTYHNQLPNHIRIVFPRSDDQGIDVDPDGRVYALTYAVKDILTLIAGPGKPALEVREGPYMPDGTCETYFTSMVANFAVDGEFVPAVPWNRQFMLYLAEKASTHIVEWRRHHAYDQAFPGLELWTPTGFDDWIEIHFDPETPVTRVRSMPYNWRANKLLNTMPLVPIESSTSSCSTCASSRSYESESSTSSSIGSSSSESPTSGAYRSQSVNVVTDVYCEDNEIRVCTRTLTFPFIIQIGEEDCGMPSGESGSSASSVSSFSSASSTSSLSSVTSSSSCSSSVGSSSSSSSCSSGICDSVNVTKFGFEAVVPDCTGSYPKGTNYGGKPSYFRQLGGWYLWWDTDDSQWIISVNRGTKSGAWWENGYPTPKSDFNPHGTAIGAVMGDC